MASVLENDDFNDNFSFEKYLTQISESEPIMYVGYVTAVNGLEILSKGPIAQIGEICTIKLPDGKTILSEVAGLDEKTVKLTAYGDTQGIQVGCEVVGSGKTLQVPVGWSLLGRTIDATGKPCVGLGEIVPEAFYPSALAFGQEDGRQLAIPYECAPNMMFVNKTILDREGIALPDPDWTWEDFLSICRQVPHSTDETGVVNQFGVSGYTWVAAFTANGVSLFNEAGTSCDFTVPPVGEAISFLENLQNANSGYNVADRDFSGGNVAFQPMMFSRYRAYKSRELSLKQYSGFEWDCITMPAGPSGDNVSRLDTLCVAMNSRTSQEKETWELLKLLTYDKEIQKEIFDYSEGISPLSGVTESEETADMIRRRTGTEVNTDTLRRAMGKSVIDPRFSGYEEAKEDVSLAVRSILESNANLQMEQILWDRTISSYLKARK